MGLGEPFFILGGNSCFQYISYRLELVPPDYLEMNGF